MLRELLEEIIPVNKQFRNFEVRHEFPSIGLKVMMLNGKRIEQKGGHQQLILLAIEDITEKKQAEDHLRYVSFHDTVTGLYNRVFIEEEIKRLDTKRFLPICFIMGDVNYLKLTNDAFGHEEGDLLLQEMAKVLKSSCRAEDIVARFGSDEFLILLPKTSYATATRIVDRIEKRCRKISVLMLRPSIALGISCKKKTNDNILNTIKTAEKSMYNNKVTENKQNRENIIASLLAIMEQNTPGTIKHVQRVKDL
ncbi:MAG: diguanylate cyclase, partial [Planctomycetota bacterium]